MIQSNYNVVVKELRQLGPKAYVAAAKGLSRGLQIVAGIAQKSFLSGPRPLRLDVRTTRLRNSISTKVEKRGNDYVGRIGTNVVYGAFHEFGFSGVQQVKAHNRIVGRVSGTGQDMDGRRRWVDRAGRVIGMRDSHKRMASIQKKGLVLIQQVKAHTRNVTYKGRPFVKPALEKGSNTIQAQIRKEIKATLP